MSGDSAASWKVGDVRITRVVELEIKGPVTWILPDATGENLAREAWLQPHFASSDGTGVMSVHALIVESPGRRILVDTCIGNDKERTIPNWNLRQGPFLDDLERAGFAPESIDTVMCTHLHVDHVGWNTKFVDGRWMPTFPRARYLFNREEYDYWSNSEDRTYGDVMGDSFRQVFDAGLVDLVEASHVVSDEVRLEPTPGHTPGHVSVHIESRGEHAVITGDLMHHPVQCAHPDWGSSADVDGPQAEKTRRAFLERYAGEPVLVIGTHFATPTAGHIVRDGDSWRFAV
jgi:glyoxylase-like metal-dependent hydrolase (beta-lactamase superfamily II)